MKAKKRLLEINEKKNYLDEKKNLPYHTSTNLGSLFPCKRKKS